MFAIYLPPSLLGRGAADIIGYMNKVSGAVKKETGYELSIEVKPSIDSVISALKKGDADAAWLPPFYYARYLASDKTPDFEPVAQYEAGGSRKSRACLYVRKDSDVKDIDGLVSASVAFPDQTGWVRLNQIFEAQKFLIPPIDFFGEHEEISRESAAYALHLKEVNAIVLEEPYIPYIEQTIKGFRKEIRPVGCSPAMSNALIVVSKKAGADKTTKLKKMLLGMHNGSGFKAIRRFFTMSGGKWVSAGPGSMTDWIVLYQKAYNKGWMKDYSKIEK